MKCLYIEVHLETFMLNLITELNIKRGDHLDGPQTCRYNIRTDNPTKMSERFFKVHNKDVSEVWNNMMYFEVFETPLSYSRIHLIVFAHLGSKRTTNTQCFVYFTHQHIFFKTLVNKTKKILLLFIKIYNFY